MRTPSAIFFLCALFLPAFLGGCGVEPDRLYALPLAHAPDEGDWARAVPLRLTAAGGITSLPGESDVDADSVHKATASCHHGGQSPPVKVELKAFHTPDRLYLRLRWGDPTGDFGPWWRWQVGKWRASGERRDGLGLLFGVGDPGFTCVRTCHLSDWRLAGKRAFADYAMRAPAGTALDFWIWRAGRGSMGGAAEDAGLGPNGKTADGIPEGVKPPDFETPNSVFAREGKTGAFGEGDGPVSAPAPEPDASAPGMLLADPAPGRNEIVGSGVHENGGWTVTLSRALAGRDPGDASFRVGGDYVFGLAVLDGVALDHNAVALPVRLRLVAPEAIRGTGAGESP